MMQSADILASGGEDYEKNIFAAVFAGALLGFTSCGNREMVTDPRWRQL